MTVGKPGGGGNFIGMVAGLVIVVIFLYASGYRLAG